MPKGFNKANSSENIYRILETFDSKEVQERPCVFISHKKEDKRECRIIADYFKNAEIDYYLDELDNELQQAVAIGNCALITTSIKKGIRESTHMLVIVSEITAKSHWVPFEIGYGHAAIVDKFLDDDSYASKIKLAILTLKNISERELPDFMQVGHIIRGTKSLNEYLSLITGKIEKSLLHESRIIASNIVSHPLDEVLNWKL